jgi:hypothetical protein
VRDTRYQSASIFGAVCPARGVGAALVMPRADTEAMTEHLAEISRHVAEDAHAVVVLDGAGWHGSDDLVVPENTTAIELPPYSPELNPAENIWEYLRKNKLANRLYDTYEDIVDVCCAAWNALIEDPARITSIASRDWANVSQLLTVGSLHEVAASRFLLTFLVSGTAGLGFLRRHAWGRASIPVLPLSNLREVLCIKRKRSCNQLSRTHPTGSTRSGRSHRPSIMSSPDSSPRNAFPFSRGSPSGKPSFAPRPRGPSWRRLA